MKKNFTLILPPSHSLLWTWSYILYSIYHYLKLPYQPFSLLITSTFSLKVETLLALFTAESQVLKMAPQHDKHLTYWLSEYGALLQNSSCWQRFQEAAPGVGPRSRSRPGQVLHCSHKWKPRQQATSIQSLITALRLGSQALAKYCYLPRKVNTLKGTQECHQRMK